MFISEASTSTMYCHEGSDCIRVGAEAKCQFSLVKVVFASVVQLKGLAEEVSWDKGEAT